MQQILFNIPIRFGIWPDGIHIYGYGAMLFLAILACAVFLAMRARQEGLDSNKIIDAAFWVILCGVVGARIVFMAQYRVPWQDFYKFWEGGLVFYGSAIGGAVGYALYWAFVMRKTTISTWQLADLVAPTVCIGLAIGRIGCLLNGCCFGHVCLDNGIRFPTLPSPVRALVVDKGGYQTAAGFSIHVPAGLFAKDALARVGAVEPGSAAAAAGLLPGDLITHANDRRIDDLGQLQRLLQYDWPKGEKWLALTVRRSDAEKEIALPPFKPLTLRIHPTQIYETISMCLLFVFLLTLFPYRVHEGMLFPLLMCCYAVHRFLNESLRDDTDPVLANLTLSQVISIGMLVGGVALELYLWRFAARVPRSAPAAPAQGHA